MPLPDKWSDGSLNVCVADPHTRLALAFHRGPLPPPHREGTLANKRTAGPKKDQASGRARAGYRWRSPDVSDPSLDLSGKGITKQFDGQSSLRHETVLGTLGSVPGKVDRSDGLRKRSALSPQRSPDPPIFL